MQQLSDDAIERTLLVFVAALREKSISTRRLYNLCSIFSFLSFVVASTFGGVKTANLLRSYSDTHARSMGSLIVSFKWCAINCRQISTNASICKKSEDINIDTTIDLFNFGGSVLSCINCISHSKTSTSQ